MKTALIVLIFISSLAVIISVVLQEAKDSGMSGVITGTQSLFGKGKAKSLDATLQRITVIFGAILAVSVFAMGVFFA